MKKLILTFASFLFMLQVSAATLKSEGQVDAHMLTDPKMQVEVTVKPGFHINDKAPNKLTILPSGRNVKAESLDAHAATFNLPKLGETDHVKAAIYVCDDALTVCETREWTWNAQGQTADANSVQTPKEAKRGKVQVKHGFYMDSLDTALNECRAKKKPVMLEFSARWCPGCMRMEKEIWDNPEMKVTLAKYAKVKLDSDRFENKSTMQKYVVSAIPTTLILNCDGEELERFVDYQDPHQFQRALDHLAKDAKDLPTHAQLAQKAEGGDAVSAEILAKRSALCGSNEDALKWYEKVPTRENELEYWWAATGQAASDQEKSPSESNKAKLIVTLHGALKQFPETPSALDWRSQLADALGVDKPEGKKALEELVQFCNDLIKDPARMEKFDKAEFSGDYKGIESLKIFETKAEALEALKKDDEAKLAWKDGVTEWKRLGLKDEPTGQFFRFLIFLKKSGEKERIQTFFERALKKKKNDPEIQRRYAKFLQEQGEYQKSADMAKKSLEKSYDQNEIFAATIYATSLAKMGQNSQAKEFLLKYQARTDLPPRSREEIETTLAQIK